MSQIAKEEKRWTGKTIEATFRTQEGFEKTMNVPEFRWSWQIPVKRRLRAMKLISKEMTGPEPIEEMETGLDRKEFYFEKWLDEEKTKALYLAK